MPGEEVAAPGDGVTLYRDGRYSGSTTDEDFGPRVVESFAPEGVTLHARMRTRRSPPSTAATRLRRSCSQPVTVEQVARFAQPARRCRRSRRSSIPKLTSGLLFHPV